MEEGDDVDVLNLIGKDWLPGAGTIDELDPSTGGRLLTAPRSGPRDVEAAVSASRDAAGGWASTPAPDRGDVLHRAAALVERDAGRLTDLMVEEVGKPVREARGEVARTAAVLRYFAADGRRSGGDLLPSDTGDVTLTMRQPVGVVGLITPWNFPLAIPAWKLGPALVSGNAVVLKPAEEAARMATLLASIMLEAGLPAGVLNVVCGDAEAGRALVEAPGVDAISFTGSMEAGASVRRAAAERGIRVQLEMGGKNVAIVLADADPAAAAAAVAGGAFGFAGQKCTATGLALVERAAAKAFLPALEAAAAAVTVGPPAEDSTACGPLIRPDALDRAAGFGAARRAGDGFYAEPALRRDVTLDDPASTQELFAPVLPVAEVEDLQEAVAVANALPTGLSAGIHTRDAGAIWRFLRSVDAGTLAVNRPTSGLEVQAPFGGLKASGSEHKEQGQGAVDFYTETKTVYWTIG